MKFPKLKFPRLVNAVETGVEDLPTAAELGKIGEGSLVKVCDGFERFWVVVMDRPEDGIILGTVDNVLLSQILNPKSRKLRFGDVIAFGADNVYEVGKGSATHRAP